MKIIGLSEVQQTILKHYAMGRTRSQMKDLMGYCHSNLSKLCSDLKRQLGLSNETQLILCAYKIAGDQGWNRW